MVVLDIFVNNGNDNLEPSDIDHLQTNYEQIPPATISTIVSRYDIKECFPVGVKIDGIKFLFSEKWEVIVKNSNQKAIEHTLDKIIEKLNLVRRKELVRGPSEDITSLESQLQTGLPDRPIPIDENKKFKRKLVISIVASVVGALSLVVANYFIGFLPQPTNILGN